MIEGTLVNLHAEFILKNGRKSSVVLPYREFKALQEKLEDLEDLRILDEAKRKEGRKKNIPFTKVKKDLGF